MKKSWMTLLALTLWAVAGGAEAQAALGCVPFGRWDPCAESNSIFDPSVCYYQTEIKCYTKPTTDVAKKTPVHDIKACIPYENPSSDKNGPKDPYTLKPIIKDNMTLGDKADSWCQSEVSGESQGKWDDIGSFTYNGKSYGGHDGEELCHDNSGYYDKDAYICFVYPGYKKAKWVDPS